ncbi:MAG TPA: hypothetical protein ENL22_01920, partial [candidate division Zixibacteria bacterium]|nr:hypothetical protein [candidate division Zixibacteria bacterium]
MSEKSNRNNPEREPEKKDCMYGKVAIAAAELAKKNKNITPRKAWEKVVGNYTTSEASRKKSCPQNAFLGLCEEGMIKDIDKG